MACCDWGFDTNPNEIYAYKTNHTYIVGKNHVIKTILWGYWLYCDTCHTYLGESIYKYPTIVSLSLSNYLIDDVVNHILQYYHLLKNDLIMYK